MKCIPVARTVVSLTDPKCDAAKPRDNLRNVNRELMERGILQSSKDGKADQSLALPGIPKARAYVVDATKLFADEGEAFAVAA